MTRRHLAFQCAGETLAATLDAADGTTGLLLVSGGSEVRSGAFGGQAELAALVAARGHPVLRFDRRGVGDSSGEDPGFAASGPDIACALAAFRAEAPQLARIVAFGNCDAASALLLAGGDGCDALVLANPWTIERDEGALPPPAAVRARYAERLKSPAQWRRLLGGEVSFGKLAKGLVHALRPPAPPTSLARQVGEGLAAFGGDVRILLAERDRTAQAFVEQFPDRAQSARLCAGASHAFAEEDARAWLLGQLLEALSG